MRRLIVIGLLAALAVSATAAASSSPSGARSSSLAAQLALARVATAKYVTNLERAKADGYQVITPMIPSMGYHYLNPNVKGFDVRRPPILVYTHRGADWQLGALEWIFPKKPTTPPIPGAKYGTFGAACHYVDGTFVLADSPEKCAATNPATGRGAAECGAVPDEYRNECAAAVQKAGAKFNFWHGPLVTLHVWLWYPNPAGLYAGMNPLVSPFDNS
jgi:hypothetical protein